MRICVSLAASQAAAQARNSAGQHSAAASSITGMSLQEAQQILHISELTPEAIQKVETPRRQSLATDLYRRQLLYQVIFG